MQRLSTQAEISPEVLSLEERLVQCPYCKAMQTLSFTGSKLVPTRKFSQKEGKIYHDCGSLEPCHVFGAYKEI